MKIKKQDFYAAIKEVMVEMIMSGEMTNVLTEANQMAMQRGYRPTVNGYANQQMMQQPRNSKFNNTARNVAKVIGRGDPKQTSVFESVFADMEEQAMAQNNSEMLPPEYDSYDVDYQQYPQQHQYPQQQYVPQHQYPQQQMGQMGGNGYVSRAEELAFGTPIKNRPTNEMASLGGFGGSGNYLPGITKNHNG